MLMADMTESERRTVRQMNVHWLPEGAELLEIVAILWSGWECDHGMALVRMPGGVVRLHLVAGVSHPDNADPIGMLEERIGAYEAAVGETRRFLEIARAALGEPDHG